MSVIAMPDSVTAEEQYRQLAAEARALSASEADPYKKRQLQLSAQHYNILADRAKRTVETRRSRARKSA
jgi:hypothetical protein